MSIERLININGLIQVYMDLIEEMNQFKWNFDL